MSDVLHIFFYLFAQFAIESTCTGIHPDLSVMQFMESFHLAFKQDYFDVFIKAIHLVYKLDDQFIHWRPIQKIWSSFQSCTSSGCICTVLSLASTHKFSGDKQENWM